MIDAAGGMARHTHWTRPHPFALGQVIGALAIGVLSGALFNLLAVLVFCLGLAAGAAVSALVCRWRPGFDAAGWKLWLVGTLANPVTFLALAYSASEYECLIGRRTGWDCLLVEIGPFVAGLGCLPPIVGLLVRWWAGRSRSSRGE
jgi:hypothetical protein